MLARRIVLGSAVPLLLFSLLAVESPSESSSHEVPSPDEMVMTAPLPSKVTGPPDHTITFAGTVGARPDPAVWRPEVGGNGWGNDEVQTYTADAANAHLDGSGRLVITARRESRTGADGITRNYTSARLTTEGHYNVPPGSYVEASITAPTGTGLWPAFWLAGADVAQVGWPASGELDIFEGWGAQPTVAHSAVHLAATGDPHDPRQYGWDDPGGTTDLGAPLDGRAHRYGVYFDGQVVRFYIDAKPTMTVWASDATAAGSAWPFGQPQHLLLNVAVSGGQPPTDDFPKSMIVSEIKVWKGGIPF